MSDNVIDPQINDSTAIDHRETEETPRAPVMPSPDQDVTPAAPISTRAAIEQALKEAEASSDADVDKAGKEPEAEKDDGKDKPEKEVKPEKPRSENGKFAKKEAPEADAPTNEGGDKKPEDVDRKRGFREETDEEYQRRRNAPESFVSPKARELWHQAPNEVKREVHRIMEEREAERQLYHEAVTEHESLKQYREMAAQHNTSLDRALENYVGIEKLLSENPIAGINKVLSNIGTDLPQFIQFAINNPQVVQQALNQPMAQPPSPEAQQLQQLQQEVQQMRIERAANDIIEPFRQSVGAENFDYLAPHIDKFLRSDIIPQTVSPSERLELAYEMAERVYSTPGLQPRQPAADLAAPAARDVSEKPVDKSGTLSVTGAPSGGNTGSAKRTPKNSREALEMAFASAR